MKLYEAIAQNARILESVNDTWKDAAEARQERIQNLLPHGSGFDAGTELIRVDDSKIVFETEFHHMSENGFYDGWTQHRVTVRANLMHGIAIDVSGKNKNDIKEYIAEVFDCAMRTDFDWMGK